MTDDFLDRLSQPRPDPGGGAAAAHGGLLALALMENVARLEVHRNTVRAFREQSSQAEKPGHRSGRTSPDQQEGWADVLGRVQHLTREFCILRERDTAAYLKLAELRRSLGDAPQLAQAWTEAIQCPVLMIKASVQAAQLLSWLGRHCSRHLVPDLQVAAEFLVATLRGAFCIAMSNVHASDGELDMPNSPGMSELLATATDQFQILWDQLGMSPILKIH